MGLDDRTGAGVRTALDPLAALADRRGAVLVGIAHFSKGSSTDAASLITGSGAFKNVPRTIFGFARNYDERVRRVMSQVKISLGRDDLPSPAHVIEPAEVATRTGSTTTARFRFVGETDRSVEDVLRASAAPEDRAEVQEAADWLTNHLAAHAGQSPARDVLTAGRRDGYTDDQLKRAKRRAGVVSEKSGGPGTPWIWRLCVSGDPVSEH